MALRLLSGPFPRSVSWRLKLFDCARGHSIWHYRVNAASSNDPTAKPGLFGRLFGRPRPPAPQAAAEPLLASLFAAPPAKPEAAPDAGTRVAAPPAGRADAGSDVAAPDCVAAVPAATPPAATLADDAPAIPAPARAAAAPAAELPPVRCLVQEVVFSRDGGNADNLLGRGWSAAEPGHRWAIGTESEITLAHPGTDEAVLEIDAFTFVPPLPGAIGRMVVVANDMEAAQLSPRLGQRQTVTLTAEALVGHGALRLVFRHPDCGVPADFGHSQDRRRLGACFQRLALFSLAPTGG